MISTYKTSGIYKITSIKDGKCYIGSSNKIRKRINEHIKELEKQTHCNKYIQRIYNKHGLENFKFEILATCPSEYLLKMEQWFINTLKPELNICKDIKRPFDNCTRTRSKVSEKTKQKISNSLKQAHKNPKKYVTKINCSIETKNNISEALKKRRNENNYGKLNKEDVIFIRENLMKVLNKEIAKSYNVTEATISLVKLNKTWKNIK